MSNPTSSISSALRPLWPFAVGLALFAASCGVATPEVSFERVDTGDEVVDDDSADQTDDDKDADAGVVPVTTATEDEPTEDQATEDQPTEDLSTAAAVPEGLNGLGDASFCNASADYWVAANSGNYINMNSQTELRLVFDSMGIELDQAIAEAPDDELAEPALIAREHLNTIRDVLVEFNWDYTALEGNQSYAAVSPSLVAMGEIDDLLQEYLAGPCNFDQDELERRAELTGDAVINHAAELDAQQQDIPDGGFIEIVDATDRLRVEVPFHWEDVQSEPNGPQSSLTIAPDVSAYLTTWAADGLKMTVSNAPANIDWRSPMFETNAANECTLIDSTPYSDPLYTGWIDRYAGCGGFSTAVVIGATDADLSVEILVEVQFDTIDTEDDDLILSEIINSFQAR